MGQSTADEIHLEFEGISLRAGDQHLLHGSSGRVKAGQAIWLRGKNGTGKSTLLRVLAGLLEPDSGRVSRRQCGYRRPLLVPTTPDSMLFPWYTAERNLRLYSDLARDRIARFAPAERQSLEQSITQLYDRLFRGFNLDPLLPRRPHTFSAGEKAKLAIACGLLFQPSTLMLDEVFNSIDDETTCQVRSVLNDFCSVEKSISLVIVSHQEVSLVELAGAEWVLERGLPLARADRSGVAKP